MNRGFADNRTLRLEQLTVKLRSQRRKGHTLRTPTHPGEMLLEEFLQPLGITQSELATAIHVPFQRVNEVVRRRRGVSPSTALRLSKFLGATPDFWMNLQLRWDLYHAQRSEAEQIESIRPRELASAP